MKNKKTRGWVAQSTDDTEGKEKLRRYWIPMAELEQLVKRVLPLELHYCSKYFMYVYWLQNVLT